MADRHKTLKELCVCAKRKQPFIQLRQGNQKAFVEEAIYDIGLKK